jgi:hypothetical protein
VLDFTVDHIEFKQGGAFMEALSGGCVPNNYYIRDRTAKWNARQNGGDAKAEKDAPIGDAYFVMKEESSCWCRGCCNPAQPTLVKFWNTSPPEERPGKLFLFLTFSYFF